MRRRPALHLDRGHPAALLTGFVDIPSGTISDMSTARDPRVISAITKVLEGARILVSSPELGVPRELGVVWAKEARDLLEHLELLDHDRYLLDLADEVIAFPAEQDG
jgi:hypothetical protein